MMYIKTINISRITELASREGDICNVILIFFNTSYVNQLSGMQFIQCIAEYPSCTYFNFFHV